MTDANTIGRTSAAREPTAAEAYAHRLRRCAVMVDWLVGELECRAGGPVDRPADYPAAAWALAEAERELAAALALLVGTDEPSVTAAIDEAVG